MSVALWKVRFKRAVVKKMVEVSIVRGWLSLVGIYLTKYSLTGWEDHSPFDERERRESVTVRA